MPQSEPNRVCCFRKFHLDAATRILAASYSQFTLHSAYTILAKCKCGQCERSSVRCTCVGIASRGGGARPICGDGGGRGPVEVRVRRRARRDGLLVDGAVVVVQGAAVVAGVMQHGLVGLEVVEGGRVAVRVQREPVRLLLGVSGQFNALLTVVYML